MAVFTRLSRAFIETMCAIHPAVGVVQDVAEVPRGSINTTYRVQTDRGLWFLRVNEGKTFAAMLHERDVLDALAPLAPLAHRGALPAAVPTLERNAAGGVFFPFEDEAGATRRACLFPALPGREPAVFELTPVDAAAVGDFLGAFHARTRRLRLGRRNPFGAAFVAARLAACPDTLGGGGGVVADGEDGEDAGSRRAGHASWGAVLAQLTEAWQRGAPGQQLPGGLVHGELFPDNARFASRADRAPQLVAVFDWEMAGRDALLWDVATALLAWCFARGTGGAPEWDRARAEALLHAYVRRRPLTAAEERALWGMLCRVTVRFCVSRLWGFELSPAARAATRSPAGAEGESAPTRQYLDPRDMLARLALLQALPRRASIALPPSPRRR